MHRGHMNSVEEIEFISNKTKTSFKPIILLKPIIERKTHITNQNNKNEKDFHFLNKRYVKIKTKS